MNLKIFLYFILLVSVNCRPGNELLRFGNSAYGNNGGLRLMNTYGNDIVTESDGIDVGNNLNRFGELSNNNINDNIDTRLGNVYGGNTVRYLTPSMRDGVNYGSEIPRLGLNFEATMPRLNMAYGINNQRMGTFDTGLPRMNTVISDIGSTYGSETPRLGTNFESSYSSGIPRVGMNNEIGISPEYGVNGNFRSGFNQRDTSYGINGSPRMGSSYGSGQNRAGNFLPNNFPNGYGFNTNNLLNPRLGNEGSVDMRLGQVYGSNSNGFIPRLGNNIPMISNSNYQDNSLSNGVRSLNTGFGSNGYNGGLNSVLSNNNLNGALNNNNNGLNTANNNGLNTANNNGLNTANNNGLNTANNNGLNTANNNGLNTVNNNNNKGMNGNDGIDLTASVSASGNNNVRSGMQENSNSNNYPVPNFQNGVSTPNEFSANYNTNNGLLPDSNNLSPHEIDSDNNIIQSNNAMTGSRLTNENMNTGYTSINAGMSRSSFQNSNSNTPNNGYSSNNLASTRSDIGNQGFNNVYPNNVGQTKSLLTNDDLNHLYNGNNIGNSRLSSMNNNLNNPEYKSNDVVASRLNTGNVGYNTNMQSRSIYNRFPNSNVQNNDATKFGMQSAYGTVNGVGRNIQSSNNMLQEQPANSMSGSINTNGMDLSQFALS